MYSITFYLKINNEWYLQYYYEKFSLSTAKKYLKRKLEPNQRIKVVDLKTNKELKGKK